MINTVSHDNLVFMLKALPRLGMDLSLSRMLRCSSEFRTLILGMDWGPQMGKGKNVYGSVNGKTRSL